MGTTPDDLSRLCGPSAFVLTCPVPEMIVVNILQMLLVMTSCFFFCDVVQRQDVLSLQPMIGSRKVLFFWTVMTWSQILSLLVSFLPTHITTAPIFECLRTIYRVSALLGYFILADEALIILKGIRFRFVMLLQLFKYAWYVTTALLLSILALIPSIDPNLILETKFGTWIRRIVCIFDSIVMTYIVVVLSLTFILNTVVTRSMPRGHLLVMRSLCFFMALMCLLKVILYLDTYSADLSYMEIWLALDRLGRARIQYTITSVFGFLYSILCPAYLSVSVMVLTRIDEVEHKSRSAVSANLLSSSDSE